VVEVDNISIKDKKTNKSEISGLNIFLAKKQIINQAGNIRIFI
jgi:hypothetical protein